jgi:hypothetical protein
VQGWVPKSPKGGDGEVTVVTDETLGEKDPLLAKLLAAAAVGEEVAGLSKKRQPIRIMLDPDERPVGKGVLCGQAHGFNLQAATRVAANDKDGRERLCRRWARAKRAWGGGRAGRPKRRAATDILRPPLANDRVSVLDDGNVRLDFKRAWSDGTSAVELAPLALITRLAALVVPSGPWACPPYPCPTRLRRARRRRHGGIPSFTVVCFLRTHPHARRWCPTHLPLDHARPVRTTRRADRSTSGGQTCYGGYSGSRPYAQNARSRCA